MKLGAFTFLLHSHIPYCRQAGRWPHGEEWLHEAASGTYLPLLLALLSLRERGIPFRLTITMTPVLLEQLADPLIREHLEAFLKDKVRRAEEDVKRLEKEEHRARLARFYRDRYQGLLEGFYSLGGDLVGGFRGLQEEGHIEVVASAATHAYLPLLERDSSIFAQLRTGVEGYRHHFRREPRSLWLPECGYRPGFFASEGEKSHIRPGLEAFLEKLGIGLFFVETHLVEGGEPVGKAMGGVLGPYGDIPRRFLVPPPAYREPTLKSTYLPYWVWGAPVAAIGRNNRTGMQVWSADWGYPGDFRYREFHKKDGVSGLQYWKVTGARLDLAHKDLYSPEEASQAVAEHSEHYSRLVEELLASFHRETGHYGIILAAYDTELFGHWWFEGVEWLSQVLEKLSRSTWVEMVTASSYLEAHPPEDVLALPEGSWGQAGGHFTWDNGETRWVWPLIHEAERRMEGLVARYPQAQGPLLEVLSQAGREVLLLQSSDWPFLITTGQAREYATLRFQEHLQRFNSLARVAEDGEITGPDLQLCRELWERDKVFPRLDYRHFEGREGP